MVSSLKHQEITADTISSMDTTDEDLAVPFEGEYNVGGDGVLTPLIIEAPPQSSSSCSPSNGSVSGRPAKARKLALQDTIAKAMSSFSTIVENRFNSTANVSSSDMNFMKSVVEDMQLIPPTKKIKFKREVLELLEKYTADV